MSTQNRHRWTRTVVASELRHWWVPRSARMLRLACAAMAVLALGKLGSEFYRLVADPGVKGAIDLKTLREYTVSWFSGAPVYELFVFGTYPPATAPLLWPLLGWLPLTEARWLWACTSVLALLWLVRAMVDQSKARSPPEAAFVALMCLSLNALGVTIGNGQLALHVLACVLAAILLLQRYPRGRGPALLAAGLLVWSLCKPTLSAPFLCIVLFLPGGWRALLLAGGAYAALTLFAVSLQDASLTSLLSAWLVRGTVAAGTGYGNVQTWLVALGVSQYTLPALLLIMVACGAWVYRHRRKDLWLQLGVVAIVARLWAYHRKYDDLLILLPMVTLFRIARRGRLPRDRDVWAGLLLAITIMAMLVPARLRFAPDPWSWLFTGGHLLVWLAVLAFLLHGDPDFDGQERRT